jgi:hypothetical protein
MKSEQTNMMLMIVIGLIVMMKILNCRATTYQPSFHHMSPLPPPMSIGVSARVATVNSTPTPKYLLGTDDETDIRLNKVSDYLDPIVAKIDALRLALQVVVTNQATTNKNLAAATAEVKLRAQRWNTERRVETGRLRTATTGSNSWKVLESLQNGTLNLHGTNAKYSGRNAEKDACLTGHNNVNHIDPNWGGAGWSNSSVNKVGGLSVATQNCMTVRGVPGKR